MLIRTTIFAALLATAMQPAALLACGYDNPQSIALGSLNWIYPDALHVRTAVSQAEASGLLDANKAGAQSGAFAFFRATAAMKSFGTNLADPRLAKASIAVSVVLIPQALWTRFEIHSDGVIVQGHAEGPLESDVVIVTEEAVIRAIVDETLPPDVAEDRGLLRFYGDLGQIQQARAALATRRQKDQALPVRFSTPVSTTRSGVAEEGTVASPANL